MTERLSNLSSSGLFVRTKNNGNWETVLRSNDKQLIRTRNGLVDIGPLNTVTATNLNISGNISGLSIGQLDDVVTPNVLVSGDVLSWDGSNWVPTTPALPGLILSMDDLSDADMVTTPPTNGQALVYDGSNWVPGNNSTMILNELTDVDTTSTAPVLNQSLIYNGTQWVPGSASISLLSDIGNVSATTPTSGQVLLFNAGSSMWEPGVATLGGIETLSDVSFGGVVPSAGEVLTYNASGTWESTAVPQIWTVNGSDINFTTGNVGVGIASPTVPLDVVGDIQTTTNVIAAGTTLTFTGQHYNRVKNIENDKVEDYVGMIVCANNNEYIKLNNGIVKGNKAITIDEALPVLSVCSTHKDPSVFGVICSKETESTCNQQSYRVSNIGGFVTHAKKEYGDSRVIINSLGEGAMWVTNKDGNLKSGDYITSSSIPGYGTRQASEFLANYTVAKITMDCDFEPKLKKIETIKQTSATVKYYRHKIESSDLVTIKAFMKVRETRVAKTDLITLVLLDKEFSTKDVITITEDDENIIYHEVADSRGYVLEDNYFVRDVTPSQYASLPHRFKSRYKMICKPAFTNEVDLLGNLVWETSDEHEFPYETRFLNSMGKEITKKEYDIKKSKKENVYIAAFVGVTYHCG